MNLSTFVDESKLYSNEGLGELEKAVETLACWLVFPQHFSLSQELSQTSVRAAFNNYITELEISVSWCALDNYHAQKSWPNDLIVSL